MAQTSYNCVVCAKEFDESELHSIVLSDINVTKYKICQNCLNLSDPADNYKQARDIVDSYSKVSKLKALLNEAKTIMKSIEYVVEMDDL